jgi:hypothetical protein
MIKLKTIIENVDLIPRFSVGDRIIVIYPNYGNVEKSYKIVEIKKYPVSGNILYIYETAPGHRYCVLEKFIDEFGKVTKDNTGLTNY